MIFKYELRFVAFTWPTVGRNFVSGIKTLKNLKTKNLKKPKMFVKKNFLPALMASAQ